MPIHFACLSIARGRTSCYFQAIKEGKYPDIAGSVEEKDLAGMARAPLHPPGVANWAPASALY